MREFKVAPIPSRRAAKFLALKIKASYSTLFDNLSQKLSDDVHTSVGNALNKHQHLFPYTIS